MKTCRVSWAVNDEVDQGLRYRSRGYLVQYNQAGSQQEDAVRYVQE